MRALLDVQRSTKPDVFFLSETHLGKAKAETLMRKLGCDRFAYHESDGRSGGLMMCWRSENKIRVFGVTENYIDTIVQEEREWGLTGLYGEPRWEHKEKTWEVLRSLHGVSQLPWMVFGDFNEILFNHEKEGGRPRTDHQLQAFHVALGDCNLSDLGFHGDMFTWQRGKIRERLDHGVSNASWNMLFPNAKLTHEGMVKSDHRPILLDTAGLEDDGVKHSTKRFEARWLKEETVEAMIQAAWARASAHWEGPSFMRKTSMVHDELHVWDRETLKGPMRRMKKLKRELEQKRRGPMTDENLATQKELLVRIELLMEQEETW